MADARLKTYRHNGALHTECPQCRNFFRDHDRVVADLGAIIAMAPERLTSTQPTPIGKIEQLEPRDLHELALCERCGRKTQEKTKVQHLPLLLQLKRLQQAKTATTRLSVGLLSDAMREKLERTLNQ